MCYIKSRDMSIELMVNRRLFAMGYQYRINYKALPVKPDIVFIKKKIAVLFRGDTGKDMIVEASIST